MSTTYRIRVSGCDDETDITRHLSEAERDLLMQIAREITDASEYDCMPTMSVTETAS